MSNFAGLQLDEAIVQRAQDGDKQALSMLFKAFAPAVYTLAFRLSQSRSQADDLTQETFMQVMKALPSFRHDASLATWIRKIAVSRCLMHLRSAWHRKSLPLDSQPESMTATPGPGRLAELHGDLSGALGELSITARTVVWLYDVEGYSHSEIAASMDKTVSFSKSCLSRAHRQLRALLDAPTEPSVSLLEAEAEAAKRCSL